MEKVGEGKNSKCYSMRMKALRLLFDISSREIIESIYTEERHSSLYSLGRILPSNDAQHNSTGVWDEMTWDGMEWDGMF